MIIEIIQIKYIKLLILALAIKISKRIKHYDIKNDNSIRCKDCGAELDIEDILFCGVCIYCNTVIDCKGVHYF